MSCIEPIESAGAALPVHHAVLKAPELDTEAECSAKLQLPRQKEVKNWPAEFSPEFFQKNIRYVPKKENTTGCDAPIRALVEVSCN